MLKKDGFIFSGYITYSIVLSITTLTAWITNGKHTGSLFGYSPGWIGWIALIIAIILLSILLLIIVLRRNEIPQRKSVIQGKTKFAIYLLLMLVCLFSIYISIFVQQEKIGNSISRIWLITETTLFCILVMSYALRIHFLPSFAVSLLFIGITYACIGQISTITNYPFSLAWSEGSRYYYGSLLLSQKLYGKFLNWDVIDPARSVLQSIPFIFNLRTIITQRLWQAILWLSLPGITSYLLVRRYYPKYDIKLLLSAALIFLILLSAPVYFYLTLCIIPIILFMDMKKPIRTLFLVILCSIWAGICRINWYFVPAGFSIFLFLLEVPMPRKEYIKYFIWPAIWCISGVFIAFMSSHLYSIYSGNPSYLFGTALHSPFLWYRLFPNSTYDLGLILSAIIFFLPIYLIGNPIAILKKLGLLRSILVVLILAGFLVGGSIVSIKIGGGSNLHNLDVFIILSLVFCTYGFFSCQPIQDEPSTSNNLRMLPGLGVILTCTIIVATIAVSIPTPKQFPKNEIQTEINTLQTLSSKYEGNLLFLSERQLLATGELKPKQFEPDFDGVTLMEMVMSNTTPYLSQFYSDIQQHKFSMIITKPINSKLQDRNERFSRENNLWVKKVEIPILESYQLLAELPLSQIEIYIPK